MNFSSFLLALIVFFHSGLVSAENASLEQMLNQSCSRIEENTIVKGYLGRLDKIWALTNNYKKTLHGVIEERDFEINLERTITFDTKDELLYNWIRKNIVNDNKLWKDTGRRNLNIDLVGVQLNYCFWKFAQEENKAIGSYMTGGGGLTNVQNKYRVLAQEINAMSPPQRSLDENGNIISKPQADVISLFAPADQWQKRAGVFQYPGSGDLSGDTTTMHRNGSYAPVLPMAILLDGKAAVTTISEQVFPEMDRFIANMEQRINQYFN